MNELDFNLLNSTYGKQKTKVIVKSRNVLFKTGSVWTIKDADEKIRKLESEQYPICYSTANDKDMKKRYRLRGKLRHRIIQSLEMKNNG